MFRESLNWLNTNTLIGFTEKRGTAWHWRAEEQGEQSNHYPGPIPITDVQERLFQWQAESRRLAVEVAARITEATHSHLGLPMRWAVVEDRQAICRSLAALPGLGSLVVGQHLQLLGGGEGSAAGPLRDLTARVLVHDTRSYVSYRPSAPGPTAGWAARVSEDPPRGFGWGPTRRPPVVATSTTMSGQL